MMNLSLLSDEKKFSQVLYEKMSSINKGITNLELYEFQYALDVIKPKGGWDSIQQISKEDLASICQHEDFFKSLKEKNSNLTSKDLKICAYIKMNLSNKEIAPLMNVSVRGLETHRYRLKKKLNLESDISVAAYLINLE